MKQRRRICFTRLATFKSEIRMRARPAQQFKACNRSSAVEDYGKALDAYSNIASLYLAPIWGSIRVVLVIASTHDRFYSRITKTFGHIGDILPRLQDYHRIFDGQKHVRLTAAITEAYVDIILLCSEFKDLLHNQKKSIKRRMFSPLSPTLSSRLDSAVERFRQHRKAVEKEAEISHMIEQKQAREMVLRDKEIAEARAREQKQRDWLSRLSNINCREKNRRMQKSRHPGTGTWFLDLPEFKTWFDLRSSALMCCHGIPGCGKSVLVSNLVDSFLSPQNILGEQLATAFYYCDYADVQTLDPSNVFLSIAKQILVAVDVLPDSVSNVLETIFQDGVAIELKDIILLIVAGAKQISSSTVFILIDDVDELAEQGRKLLFSTMADLMSQASPILIKVLVTSRMDTSYLTPASVAEILTVHIDQQAIAADIEGYIKYAVRDLIDKRRLVLGNPEVEHEIQQALCAGAQGMFLWVRFQLDDICAAETDAGIRHVLKNLPRDLVETYDRILGRIERVETREYARKIFMWIACAKRPLLVDELQEAIAFSIEDHQWSAEKIPNNMDRLFRACGNLISVDNETQLVHLVHYTIQQYLLSSQIPSSSHFNISQDEANYEIGQVCVAYLSFTGFETQVTTYSDSVTPTVQALERIVASQPSLGTPIGGLAKAALRLRGYRHPSANIQYGRHVRDLGGILNLESTMEKFKLVNYAASAWLFHTTGFTLESSKKNGGERAIRLFCALLFEKNLLFDFRPWKVPLVSIEGEFNMVLPLIWAISNGSMACIQQIMVQKNHHGLESYLARASSWFFGSGFSGSDISEEMLAKLHDFSFDVLPPSSEWWGWLYYRIIVLARLDDSDKLLGFLLEWIHQYNDLTELLCGHLIWEAAGYAQVLIAKEVIDFMRHYGTWPRYWFRGEHEGRFVTALERAAICGCQEMVSLLADAGCVMSGVFQSCTLQNYMNPPREPIRDARMIVRRLRILEVADRLFQEVEGEMPFNAVFNDVYSKKLMMCLLEMLEPEMALPEVDDMIWKIPPERTEVIIKRTEVIIQSLLDEGAIPKPKNAEWLLFHAIQKQEHDQVRRLIIAGVSLLCRWEIKDLNYQGFWLRQVQFVGPLDTITPLLYAVLLSDFKIVKLILASDHRVANDWIFPSGPKERHLKKSYTALQLAAIVRSPEIFKTLLDCGADPMVLDDNGRHMIALIWSFNTSSQSGVEMVRCLCYQNLKHWARIARVWDFGSIVDEVENAVLQADKGV